MAENGRRGHLKILLGYASGVGKTFRMLEEAQKLKQQGVDVVIGYFETHDRQATMEMTEGLEFIPRRTIMHRGTQYEEMDAGAILRRHPQVCVVDEFAHTNAPGSGKGKRWQDCRAILENGIDILTNMNVQHLESLNDAVWEFSGVRVRDTVPDWVVKEANEVVMVDLPPQALLNRLKRGVVYPDEKAPQALENIFTEPALVTLRELALRQAAHEVDIRHEPHHVPIPAVPPREGERPAPSPAETVDRLLIHITADPSTAALIRRGRRMADFLDAECYAVFVNTVRGLHSLPSHERQTVDKQMNFARNLQIEARVLEGQDVAETLVNFARKQEITQIFLLRTREKSMPAVFGRNLVQQIVWLARDMHVTIVAEHRRR